MLKFGAYIEVNILTKTIGFVGKARDTNYALNVKGYIRVQQNSGHRIRHKTLTTIRSTKYIQSQNEWAS
jgi:hypothetical protein